MSRRGSYAGAATVRYTVEEEDRDIVLTITGRIDFTPGNYSGKPEDCYPDECEVEFDSIVDEQGVVWDESRLNVDATEDIKAKLFHAARKNEED